MGVFEFNNRPFLLKADSLTKREKQLCELITQNEYLIGYPYESESPKGKRLTQLRYLSSDDVRALLDPNDKRPLLDRVCWDGFIDASIQEFGVPLTPVRIAPIAHLPFRCSIVDEYMTATTYGFSLSIEDHLYLTQMVMDNPNYDIRTQKKTRPDLYARITKCEQCPRKLQPTSMILLTSAEQTVCKLKGHEYGGDESYTIEGKDGSISHICVNVEKDSTIVLSSETIKGCDIENNGELVITETEIFSMRVGGIYHRQHHAHHRHNVSWNGGRPETHCHIL